MTEFFLRSRVAAGALFISICISFVSTHAEDGGSKIFLSDYGYQLTLPNCWQVKSDDIDNQDLPATKVRNVTIDENPTCLTLTEDELLRHGLSIGVSPKAVLSKSHVRSEMRRIKKRVNSNLAAKVWLYFSSTEDSSETSYTEVDFEQDRLGSTIRWQKTIYCPHHVVTVFGPRLKNPDQKYFQKFKAGDLGLPEPIKAIFKSIRCNKSKM